LIFLSLCENFSIRLDVDSPSLEMAVSLFSLRQALLAALLLNSVIAAPPETHREKRQLNLGNLDLGAILGSLGAGNAAEAPAAAEPAAPGKQKLNTDVLTPPAD
jgi:hypothetical protein